VCYRAGIDFKDGDHLFLERLCQADTQASLEAQPRHPGVQGAPGLDRGLSRAHRAGLSSLWLSVQPAAS